MFGKTKGCSPYRQGPRNVDTELISFDNPNVEGLLSKCVETNVSRETPGRRPNQTKVPLKYKGQVQK